MIELISSMQIKRNGDNEKLDFDRYDIEIKSQLSTKEYSIIVDFLDEDITGECVAYGMWYDIEQNECIELLQEVFKNNEPIRRINFIQQ